MGGGVRLQTLQDLGDLLHEKQKTAIAMLDTVNVQHYQPSDRTNCESHVTVLRLPIPETRFRVSARIPTIWAPIFVAFLQIRVYTWVVILGTIKQSTKASINYS